VKLDDLVATKTTMMEIEEDLDQRLAWAKEISLFQPMYTCTNQAAAIISGDYHFCYRDYVNHEELMGMMCKRWGIENFLFKPSRAGLVRIIPRKDDNPCCTLSERSKLFGIVPIAINWQGRLIDSSSSTTTTDNPSSNYLRIVWDSTSMELGWKGFFGKHFDCPAVSKTLRQAPWVLNVKKKTEKKKGDDDDDNKEKEESAAPCTDILCFEKMGKGHLAFAKKERMTAESSSTFSGPPKALSD
jgi:hypothetical protein